MCARKRCKMAFFQVARLREIIATLEHAFSYQTNQRSWCVWSATSPLDRSTIASSALIGNCLNNATPLSSRNDEDHGKLVLDSRHTTPVDRRFHNIPQTLRCNCFSRRHVDHTLKEAGYRPSCRSNALTSAAVITPSRLTSASMGAGSSSKM